jgi:hypothetical protein
MDPEDPAPILVVLDPEDPVPILVVLDPEDPVHILMDPEDLPAVNQVTV